MTDNEKTDYQKWFIAKPIGFSPEYNKMVVDRSIKRYEKKRAAQKALFMDLLGERVDAATSYVMHLERSGSKTPEQYFGRKILNHLHAKDVENQVKVAKLFKSKDLRI